MDHATLINIIVLVVGAALGFGPTAAKIVQLTNIIKDAGKYLDGLSDPNPQIRQDAISKGVKGVATIIDKYIEKK